MKRSMASMAAALLVLIAIAAPLQAQARGYVGFGGGVSMPLGSFGDAVDTGYLGQVIAGITGASGKLGGRVDGMYLTHGYGPYNYRIIGFNADVVFTPSAGGKAAPYFLGGLGMFNGKSTGTGVVSDGSTDLAFNLGGGLTIKAGARMSFFAEARYISIQTEGGKTAFIPISVGLRFGGR